MSKNMAFVMLSLFFFIIVLGIEGFLLFNSYEKHGTKSYMREFAESSESGEVTEQTFIEVDEQQQIIESARTILAEAISECEGGYYTSVRNKCDSIIQMLKDGTESEQRKRLLGEVYMLYANTYEVERNFTRAIETLNEGIICTGFEDLKKEKSLLKENLIIEKCWQFDVQGNIICEMSYDTENHVATYLFLDENGSVREYEIWTYQQFTSDRLITYQLAYKERYNKKNERLWRESYMYLLGDNQLYCTGVTHENIGKEPNWEEKYTYDENWRMIKINHEGEYNGNWEEAWREEYTYTADGNATSKIYTVSDGLLYECRYQYDALGNEIGFAQYKLSGEFIISWQKEYNEWGDVVKYVSGDTEYYYEYSYRVN